MIDGREVRQVGDGRIFHVVRFVCTRTKPTRRTNRKGGQGMRRHSIARDTYGKPRDEMDATTTGKIAKARNLRVRKIADVEMSSCCGAPKGYCLCAVRNARRPRADSVMEREVYANPKTRKVMFRAKGRLA